MGEENFGNIQIFWFRLFSWFAVSGHLRRIRSLFWEFRWLKDPLAPTFISFLFLRSRRDNSSCISWILSSVFFSFNFFLMILSPFFFILNNFIRFCAFYCYSLPNLSLSITAWPCSKCTYYPGFPLHWLQSSVQQCSTRTCSHKGRNENWVTHNALYFHLGRKSNFIWRSSILLSFRISALQETRCPICVPGLAPKTEL